MPETRKRKCRILFKQGKIEYKRVATNYRKVSKRCLIRENTLDEPETAQTARFYANLKLSKKCIKPKKWINRKNGIKLAVNLITNADAPDTSDRKG